jgi:hypothetical protein
MGSQPGARFTARSADALPATLYERFTQAIYRNRPILWVTLNPGVSVDVEWLRRVRPGLVLTQDACMACGECGRDLHSSSST